MVHSKASNELLADAAMFAAEFEPALVRALSYSLDRVIVRGTGSGIKRRETALAGLPAFLFC